MRRSAWTTGAAILAALSLGVAACGGSDGGGGGDKSGTDTTKAPPANSKTGG
jgi:peptide/nickel transport system substrate-binding protein